MKQDLNPAGRPKPLRRTAARSFSLATKQQRFQEVGGRYEACGELTLGPAHWIRRYWKWSDARIHFPRRRQRLAWIHSPSASPSTSVADR